jgi:NADH-ubiquinone oxidoreductase chain 6
MNKIYLIYDFISNGLKVEFIDIIYLLSIFFGIFTIISVNPIISVLFLIGLFVSVSGLLILIGFNFIGLAYILVYVGAVSILFLFILMLINIRISELVSETNNYIPLAILTVICIYYAIKQVLPFNLAYAVTYDSFFGINNIQINNEDFSEQIVHASSEA